MADRSAARQISIALGALSRPLAEQLSAQGMEMTPGNDVTVFQRDADAITRCSVRGFASEAQTMTARRRLMRNIASAVQPKETTNG